MSRLLQEIWRSPIARWATVALAVNGLGLLNSVIRYPWAERSLTLWVPASDVQPYLDPDSRDVVRYEVKNVSVREFAKRAGWPDYLELCGLAGLNLALFAWLLRLVLAEQRQRPPVA